MTETVDMEKIYKLYKQNIMLPPIEVTPESEEPSFLEQYQETVSQPLADITKASPETYKKVVPEMISGSTKGTVSGIGGVPGEIVGLASGILNVVMPYNVKGEKHDPNKSVGEKFSEGYAAVPLKISDIRDGLTQAGWKINEIENELNTEDLFTSLFEFVSPFGVSGKTIQSGVKAIKNKTTKNKAEEK